MSALPTADRGFALRLAAFFAMLGATTGVAMPFFPVWLEAKGLDAGEIGLVLAAPMAVRIVAVPLATRGADRSGRLRGAILLSSIGGCVLHAALGLMSGFAAILLCLAVAAVAFTPIFPLTDAYALRGLAEPQRSYGPVRLWASAAFIAASIGGGAVLGLVARGDVIWLLVACYALMAVAAWRLRPLTPLAQSRAAARPAVVDMQLWRMPAFAAVIVACSLIQASHAVFYGFSTLDWTAKGLSDTVVGSLWALGVFAEIFLFAVSGRIAAAISPTALILIGAVGAVARWTPMVFDPPFALLPVLQCLHALSFGATHIGAMQFLARAVPPGLGATAQGDFTAVQSIVFALAMSVSGTLFRTYGDLAYGAMALLALLGLAVAVVAQASWRRAAGKG